MKDAERTAEEFQERLIAEREEFRLQRQRKNGSQHSVSTDPPPPCGPPSVSTDPPPPCGPPSVSTDPPADPVARTRKQACCLCNVSNACYVNLDCKHLGPCNSCLPDVRLSQSIYSELYLLWGQYKQWWVQVYTSAFFPMAALRMSQDVACVFICLRSNKKLYYIKLYPFTMVHLPELLILSICCWLIVTLPHFQVGTPCRSRKNVWKNKSDNGVEGTRSSKWC